MALLDMLVGHDPSVLRIALLCDLRMKERLSQSEGGLKGHTRGDVGREGRDGGGKRKRVMEGEEEGEEGKGKRERRERGRGEGEMEGRERKGRRQGKWREEFALVRSIVVAADADWSRIVGPVRFGNG